MEEGTAVALGESGEQVPSRRWNVRRERE